MFDVVVVGGGMAAAHAALPLAEGGLRICILDGGFEPLPTVEPEGTFETIRMKAAQQHGLFLGEDLAGLAPRSFSHAASMTSGARAYVSEGTTTQLPLQTDGMALVQSLARGGLSETWGAVCAIFTDAELQKVGIEPSAMHEAYAEVIAMIGVSGEASGFELLPPLSIDAHAQRILAAYEALPAHTRNRFSVRRPLMAVLSERKDDRGPITYRDLEYALNDQNAIYRARFTLQSLEQRRNVSYVPDRIVRRISAQGGEYLVFANDRLGRDHEIRARKVVLAAGPINTARILLQSFGTSGTPLPFLIKRNALIPCLDMASVGTPDAGRRHSLCQLTLESSVPGATPDIFAHLYSYRSLLLFRLARYVPLPMPYTLSLLALWAPALVIVDVRRPVDEPTAYLSLERESLRVSASPAAHAPWPAIIRAKRMLRTIGLTPIKTVYPPLGASVHYAGGIPFSSGAHAGVLTAQADGSLSQHCGLYIADASTWRMLPAKPPALTIMANARRIGKNVLKTMQPK